MMVRKQRSVRSCVVARISLVVFPRIRVLNGRFIGLAYRFFEASDSFTERFAQFGELARTENHQGNYKNNDQLRHTKTSEHTAPPNSITLCFGVRDVNLMVGVEPCLPLVRVPGMFLQHGFYPLDSPGVFLAQPLVSDDPESIGRVC